MGPNHLYFTKTKSPNVWRRVLFSYSLLTLGKFIFSPSWCWWCRPERHLPQVGQRQTRGGVQLGCQATGVNSTLVQLFICSKLSHTPLGHSSELRPPRYSTVNKLRKKITAFLFHIIVGFGCKGFYCVLIWLEQ